MNTVLRFIACSDLHFKTESPVEPDRLRRGLKLIYDWAERQPYKALDAVIVNGDFANRGAQEEMALVKKTFDECLKAPTRVYYTLASHEFMSPDGEAGAKQRFAVLFSQPEDCFFRINGFPFITLSCERGCNFDEEKVRWLSSCLKEAAGERDKPIFVFQHPHLSDTVYGSINWGDDAPIAALAEYPGVVDFSGHSHAPVNDPRSIHQRLFTCAGTGSLSYFELDEFDFIHGTVPPENEQCAQFLVVECSSDGAVRIRPFDILSGRFFIDGWEIPTPWEPASFTYTDERFGSAVPPVFAPSACLNVIRQGRGVEISFPQAGGDERPDAYLLTLRNGKYKVVSQQKISSRYYLYNMPGRLSFTLEDLPKGTYLAEVRPLGFWRNVGAPIVAAFSVEG